MAARRQTSDIAAGSIRSLAGSYTSTLVRRIRSETKGNSEGSRVTRCLEVGLPGP